MSSSTFFQESKITRVWLPMGKSRDIQTMNRWTGQSYQEHRKA